MKIETEIRYLIEEIKRRRSFIHTWRNDKGFDKPPFNMTPEAIKRQIKLNQEFILKNKRRLSQIVNSL